MKRSRRKSFTGKRVLEEPVRNSACSTKQASSNHWHLLQLCNSGKVAPKGFLDDDTRLIGQARGAEPL
jgi:hypothetical protein